MIMKRTSKAIVINTQSVNGDRIQTEDLAEVNEYLKKGYYVDGPISVVGNSYIAILTKSILTAKEWKELYESE